MKKQTTIPFSGFYYSIHDDEMDQALKQEFTDCQGNENAAPVPRFGVPGKA